MIASGSIYTLRVAPSIHPVYIYLITDKYRSGSINITDGFWEYISMLVHCEWLQTQAEPRQPKTARLFDAGDPNPEMGLESVRSREHVLPFVSQAKSVTDLGISS